MHAGVFAWISDVKLTTAELQQCREQLQIGPVYSPPDLWGPAESQHTANTRANVRSIHLRTNFCFVCLGTAQGTLGY